MAAADPTETGETTGVTGTAVAGTATPDHDDAGLEAGLDALETPRRERPSLLTVARTKVLPPVVAVVLVLLVWQLVAAAHIKPSYALPGPIAVWHAFLHQWYLGTVGGIVGTSLGRGALGFLLSVVLGTPLGLVVARVRFVRTAIGPILSGLQALPSVAWVPAAIIWFGLSNATIYAVILLGAVPSIANGLVAGVEQIPPIHLRAGRVLGATGLRGIRHVLLPAALPGYLAGLKQGWAFAWRSLMAAELITTSPDLGLGLGQFLDQGRELSDMPMVLCAIVLILVVGVGIELLVFTPLTRRVLTSRGL
ncbi:sulfate ABC transporter permease [Mangrovactinospora gilvigrisea]|uniref:Sulfate ABC transporter permease n=1 Tax=Mangrovactinospora gilvigrisea TaxID=1428644 RepID=A0A1J7CBA9_9ACTN|nr:ABC transporter permease [Mangrovactinospora gilvigrisea]OIV36938.1 sulfate ABC transporter permease [Mangrovactinospora gilvigrisea]